MRPDMRHTLVHHPTLRPPLSFAVKDPIQNAVDSRTARLTDPNPYRIAWGRLLGASIMNQETTSLKRIAHTLAWNMRRQQRSELLLGERELADLVRSGPESSGGIQLVVRAASPSTKVEEFA